MKRGKSPLGDAVAVWRMNGDEADLQVNGDVRLGVELDEVDAEASQARGGDGLAARFERGHLVAGDDSLCLTGSEMTFCARVSGLGNAPDAALFARDDRDDRYADILTVQNGRLEYLWRTTPSETRA